MRKEDGLQGHAEPAQIGLHPPPVSAEVDAGEGFKNDARGGGVDEEEEEEGREHELVVAIVELCSEEVLGDRRWQRQEHDDLPGSRTTEA